MQNNFAVLFGNIGAGKTYASELLEKKDVFFIDEPLKVWEELGIIEDYYADMKAWAFIARIPNSCSWI